MLHACTLALDASSKYVVVASLLQQSDIVLVHQARVCHHNKVLTQIETLLEVIYHRYHGEALVLATVEQRV